MAYAREGADVAIAYLRAEEDGAQETLRLVQEAGRKGLALPGDILEEQHCFELVRRTVEELGGRSTRVYASTSGPLPAGVAG